MFLKHNFCYYDKALAKNQIDEIIDICEQSELNKATVGEEDTIDNRSRDCLVNFHENDRIYEIITPFINKANISSDWNFSLTRHEVCQYTVYNKSQFYGYHQDSLTHPYNDEHDGRFRGMTRKLSMTLQLSDSSDYTGGDFYFKYMTSSGVIEERVDYAKNIGTIIVFPSFVWHKVEPVTTGTRKSLVCWTLGYPFT